MWNNYSRITKRQTPKPGEKPKIKKRGDNMEYKEHYAQLKEKFEKTKKEIHELEKEIKTEISSHRYTPIWEDDYYYIDAEGSVCKDRWKGSPEDRRRHAINNVFKTHLHAEHEASKLQILADLSEFTRPFLFDSPNYYFFLDEDGSLDIDNTHYELHPNGIYFENKGKAELAMAVIGKSRIEDFLIDAKTNKIRKFNKKLSLLIDEANKLSKEIARPQDRILCKFAVDAIT